MTGQSASKNTAQAQKKNATKVNVQMSAPHTATELSTKIFATAGRT